MSRKSSKKDPDIHKTSSRKPLSVSPSRARPSTSNADPKELYSYTPNWITPQEKAKLRARVKRMKMKEQRLMMKEDVVLVQASKKGSKDDSADERASSSPGKRSASVSSEDEGNLKKTKSEKSMKSDKSEGSAKSKESKESVKKEKSKESMKKEKSKDSVKSSKSERGKSSSYMMDEKRKSKDEKGKSKGGKEKSKDRKSRSKEDLRMSKENEKSKNKHPREAHANPSGNTMENQPQREVSKNDLYDHIWATDYGQFDPQLYHFKSPEKLSTKNPVLAECPPFWVLLDHTIAVTWKLFCQRADRKDLGIIPLQWSREFLNAMRDERGEYLPATGQLLSAIEDALIDRYAKAGDAKPEDDDPNCKRVCSKKDKSDCKKDQDSLSYVSSESIFKHPVEVSYTLKDIMSRNMPGRTHENADGVQSKNSAVSKVDVPPPDEHDSMSRADMLKYLKQLKEEQNLRVEKEKEHVEKIEALIDLLAKGRIDGDLWAEGHDAKKKSDKDRDKERVHFTENQKEGSVDSKSSKGDKGKGNTKRGSKESVRDQKRGSKESVRDQKRGSIEADNGPKKEPKKGKKVSMEGDKEGTGKGDRRHSDASLKSANETEK